MHNFIYMSDYWKLDISVYTLDDLQEIFSLQDPYTMEEITESYKTIQENLELDNNLEEKKKKEILVFIEEGYKELVKEKKKVMSGFINSQINTGNNHMVIKPSIQKEAQIYQGFPLACPRIQR